MIISRLIALAVASMFTLTALADDPGHGEIVEVGADYLFAPVGFDDNDQAMIVADGFLPSGCYRLAKPEMDIDPETSVISVRPMARYYDVPCVEALIPYSVEVPLGVLPQGNYEVRIEASTLMTPMEVSEATSSGPDDYLYAPIDNVSIEKLPNSTRYIGILEGRFTDSCMTLVDVRVINSDASIEVLPIMMVEDRDQCADGMFPFKRTFLLPEDMKVGRHLLHVRSLNGQAMNQVFSVYE